MSRTLLTLWLANAIVAVSVMLLLGPQPTGDTTRYLALAHSVREGFGFTIEEAGSREPEGFRMPGYPSWLALAEATSPDHFLALTLVVQQAAVLLSLGLAARAAQVTFDSQHAASFLALSALYPFMPAAACLMSPEALVAPLVSGAWLLLCGPSTWRGVLAGALVGCAVYLRPNSLILAPAVGLGVLLAKKSRGLNVAIAVVVGTSFVLTPWAIHNEMIFGHPSPLPPVGAFGRVLLVGTWEAGMSEESIHEQTRRVNLAIGVPPDTVVLLDSYKGNRVRTRANQLLTQEALRNIVERPFRYMAGVAVRTVRMWFSVALPETAPGWLLPVQPIAAAWGATVAIMGIIGAALAALKNSRWSAGVLVGLAVLVGFTATLCWAYTEARYTIPARHVLLVFASIPITGALRTLKLRWLAPAESTAAVTR